MKRTIQQWERCDPQAMATQQSVEALTDSLSDATSDILELRRKCQRAAAELVAMADELKQSSTINGEWDGTAEEAKEEYDRLMALVTELNG